MQIKTIVIFAISFLILAFTIKLRLSSKEGYQTATNLPFVEYADIVPSSVNPNVGLTPVQFNWKPSWTRCVSLPTKQIKIDDILNIKPKPDMVAVNTVTQKMCYAYLSDQDFAFQLGQYTPNWTVYKWSANDLDPQKYTFPTVYQLDFNTKGKPLRVKDFDEPYYLFRSNWKPIAAKTELSLTPAEQVSGVRADWQYWMNKFRGETMTTADGKVIPTPDAIVFNKNALGKVYIAYPSDNINPEDGTEEKGWTTFLRIKTNPEFTEGQEMPNGFILVDNNKLIPPYTRREVTATEAFGTDKVGSDKWTKWTIDNGYDMLNYPTNFYGFPVEKADRVFVGKLGDIEVDFYELDNGDKYQYSGFVDSGPSEWLVNINNQAQREEPRAVRINKDGKIECAGGYMGSKGYCFSLNQDEGSKIQFKPIDTANRYDKYGNPKETVRTSFGVKENGEDSVQGVVCSDTKPTQWCKEAQEILANKIKEKQDVKSYGLFVRATDLSSFKGLIKSESAVEACLTTERANNPLFDKCLDLQKDAAMLDNKDLLSNSEYSRLGCDNIVGRVSLKNCGLGKEQLFSGTVDGKIVSSDGRLLTNPQTTFNKAPVFLQNEIGDSSTQKWVVDNKGRFHSLVNLETCLTNTINDYIAPLNHSEKPYYQRDFFANRLHMMPCQRLAGKSDKSTVVGYNDEGEKVYYDYGSNLTGQQNQDPNVQRFALVDSASKIFPNTNMVRPIQPKGNWVKVFSGIPNK